MFKSINKDFKEVLTKGVISLLIRGIGFISGYIFLYFTIKYFGSETQGRLSLALSFMVIGSLISRLGIDINFVKIFAIENNFENAKGIYFKTIPYIFFLSSILAIIVFFGADYIAAQFFDDPKFSVFLKWTSPCIVLFSFVLINAGVFRGLKHNTLYSFLFNGGRFFFALIAFGVLLLFNYKIDTSIAVSHTTSVFALFLISSGFIHKYVFPISRNTTYKTKSFINDSLPMLFSATMTVFLGWTDTIILGIFSDSSTVGMYNVVLKIAVLMSFTLQAINSILAPKLSHAFHNNDLTLFHKLVKYSTKVNFIISLVVVVFLIVFRNKILMIFGEEFLSVSNTLIILCIGQLFNALCGPVGTILQMTGHHKVFRNILFVALLLNITLNLSLIHKMGINGVAISTAISLAFWNIVALYYTRKLIKKA